MSRPSCSRAARCIQLPRSATIAPPLRPFSSAFPKPPSHFPSFRTFQHRVRYQSSGPSQPGRFPGIRTRHVFLGITGLGLFITIYGLVEWYFALDTWPEPVRGPLRKAIKLKNQKDFVRSERYFQEAIEAARSIPYSALDPDPLLKLSGIYISLAGMLENQGQNIQAYKELETALTFFGPGAIDPDPSKRVAGDWAGNKQLDYEEHQRAVGLSQKLGQLALQIASANMVFAYPISPDGDGKGPKTWLDAAEYHLSGALSAMLRLGLTSKEGQQVVAGRDVDLPEGGSGDEEESPGGRVDKRGLGVTMESLAEVYARKEQYAVAGRLLIQAVSTLLPPKSTEQPPVRDRCQAAVLMTTISSHALHPHTPSAIKASRSWSLRSLQISEQALKEDPSDIASRICQRATCVGLYNMGMLAEIDGDLPSALEFFDKALTQARETGFVEGRRQATDAIRRVRSTRSVGA